MGHLRPLELNSFTSFSSSSLIVISQESVGGWVGGWGTRQDRKLAAHWSQVRGMHVQSYSFLEWTGPPPLPPLPSSSHASPFLPVTLESPHSPQPLRNMLSDGEDTASAMVMLQRDVNVSESSGRGHSAQGSRKPPMNGNAVSGVPGEV